MLHLQQPLPTRTLLKKVCAHRLRIVPAAFFARLSSFGLELDIHSATVSCAMFCHLVTGYAKPKKNHSLHQQSSSPYSSGTSARKHWHRPVARPTTVGTDRLDCLRPQVCSDIWEFALNSRSRLHSLRSRRIPTTIQGIFLQLLGSSLLLHMLLS